MTFEHEIAVAAIIRDEEPYLDEWLQYHQAVGVTKFYLYDNGSCDGTRNKLAPYIETGLVDYTYFPGEVMQFRAYNDAVREHRFDCRYLAFIDADEFIYPCGDEADRRQTVKPLVNPRTVRRIHNPHHADFFCEKYVINENGHIVPYSHELAFSQKYIRVNHYYTALKAADSSAVKKANIPGEIGALSETLIDFLTGEDTQGLMGNVEWFLTYWHRCLKIYSQHLAPNETKDLEEALLKGAVPGNAR